MKVTLIKLVSIVTILSLALSGCKSQSRTSPTPESQNGATPAATLTEPVAEPTPTSVPENCDGFH